MSAAEFASGLLPRLTATPGTMVRQDGGGEEFQSSGESFEAYVSKQTSEAAVRQGRNAEDRTFHLLCDTPAPVSERGAVEVDGKVLRVYSVVEREMFGICQVECDEVVT